jgi:hypothetical protein
MAGPASTAEQTRRRREAFTLAMELGCTPREAEDEIRRRIASQKEADIMRRMEARQAAPLQRTRLTRQSMAEPEERVVPWYQKD